MFEHLSFSSASYAIENYTFINLQRRFRSQCPYPTPTLLPLCDLTEWISLAQDTRSLCLLHICSVNVAPSILTIKKPLAKMNSAKIKWAVLNYKPDIRGTREAILAIFSWIILQKWLRINKATYLAFIDNEKAFGNVTWLKIFEMIKEIWIQYLYS